MKEPKYERGKPGAEKRKRTRLIIYQAHEPFTIRVEKINNSCIKFIQSKSRKKERNKD